MESNFSNATATTSMMRKCLLITLISTSALISAQATGLPPLKDKDTTVTSLGIVNNDMFFQFKLENDSEEKYIVVLTDKDGTCLYKETLNGKVINKTFQAPAEIESVYLTITNLNDKTRQKFVISPERRFMENLSIVSIP